MVTRALSVHLGSEAAQRIADRGWDPALFSLLLGASGGPKWFILGQLDRFLFGDFLQRSDQPLATLGSSIGSWRHACLVQQDPAAAIERMQAGYLYQHYESERPSPEEISEVSKDILQAVLGTNGAENLVEHPRITSHIVTARGRGPSGSASPALLATGMGAAALGNTLSRSLLRHHFQRAVFHSGEQARPGLTFDDFQTVYCPLRTDNVLQALHASGAIPFVLTGERDIAGAPPGQYWDGGIIDYHFDLEQYRGEGLLLYPHFRASIVPGWFDKFLPWRQAAIQQWSKLVLLCPDQDFVASLPHGKIPDRSDFTRLGEEERIRYWEQAVEASKAMAEEFAELVSGPDPLRGVTVHR
ncbi:alpha/beta hydrolase [Pseudohalioglobus lutimaris]|uniref:Alpha/beta hydrolase n=1 Tax=Pseudohalioglobus lutimaris TaxID=1737061 RepID=A0A2N5WZE0_9GAMM|nr:alpha/beta hydrolase [Pseudohalioglobus lutimaris]